MAQQLPTTTLWRMGVRSAHVGGPSPERLPGTTGVRSGEAAPTHYIVRALEQSRRRSDLDQFLAAAEAEWAPIPEEALSEATRRSPAARVVH